MAISSFLWLCIIFVEISLLAIPITAGSKRMRISITFIPNLPFNRHPWNALPKIGAVQHSAESFPCVLPKWKNCRSKSVCVPLSVKNAENGYDSNNDLREGLFRSFRLNPSTGENYQTLKQGSVDWLAARKFRLTASNFGTAVGHNRWKSPEELIEEMLFGKFKGNDATRWGNDREAIARNLYILKKWSGLSLEKGSPDSIHFHVQESGLHILDQQPWFAASPDGIVHESGQLGLLEIKCPFSLKLYPQIPPYYQDQIQGIMGILGCQWCDFVVWTPSKMSIKRIMFDKCYWEESLLPNLSNFYMNQFVPRYVEFMKERQKTGARNEGNDQADHSVKSWLESSSVVSFGDKDNLGHRELEWLAQQAQIRPASFPQFSMFLTGALDLNERLAKNSLRLEFIDSSSDSMFISICAQLERQNILKLPRKGTPTRGDSRADQLRKAAWKIRFEAAAHIAAQVSDFEAATGKSAGVILERLHMVSQRLAMPGAVELAAVAQMFSVHIICLVVSSQLVEERHFYPSLMSGFASLSAARGRVVLASAGGVLWSTAPLHLAGQEAGSGSASPGSLPASEEPHRAGDADLGSGLSKTHMSAGGVLARDQSGVGGEVRVEDDAARRESGAAPSSGSDVALPGNQGGPGMFGSRFSPLFQQCVVDVTGKLRRGGADELDAVRRAFSICRRSVNDRRFGSHAVRRNGQAIADVGQTAAAY
jgi:putative phage-type endonuclease